MTTMSLVNAHRVLTKEEVRARAPAVFADAPEGVSGRYSFISTEVILDALIDEGFDVMNARQSKTRGGSDFGGHELIFRPRDTGKLRKVGDTYAEVSFRNSHDGSSPAIVSGALMRLACLNGMTVPEGMAAQAKVYHTGDIINEVVEGMRKAVEASRETMERIKLWQTIELTRNEQGIFADMVHNLRFKNAPQTKVKPTDLLTLRRTDDASADLWTVTNVLQENSTRELFTGMTRRTRGINSINGLAEINEGVLTIAKAMADIKTGG